MPIGYSSSDQNSVVSVRQGIKNAVPKATVNYAQGCDTSCTDTSGFGAAVSAAQASQATVVVVGEPASDSGTSILQPVRKLEGFQRITLNPGQTKSVSFALGPQNFGFYNDQGQFTVEPGTVTVWVGDSSNGGQQGQFTIGG